ncbi:MAG: hypothetical protein JW829_10375 [Pirellulales bacterium]|nr:hypothetical protein [Pirellulales bacterium]
MRRFVMVCITVAIVAVLCNTAFAQNPADSNTDIKAKHSLWTLLGGSRLFDAVGTVTGKNPVQDVGISESKDAKAILMDPRTRLLDNKPPTGNTDPRGLLPLLTGSSSSSSSSAAYVVDVVESSRNKDGGGGSGGGRPFASPTFPWAAPTPP